jgi:glycosyltransferase involved in cell wall biosynthesis
MKIGVLCHGFVAWGGGLDFLRTICSSLAASDEAPEIHLLIPITGPRGIAKRWLQECRRFLFCLLGNRLPPRQELDIGVIREFLQSLDPGIHVHEIDLGTSAIDAVVRRHSLDVVLPSMQPIQLRSGVPCLGYITDFQHVHLGHFFSEIEIQNRNKDFTRILNLSPAVIVNAKAVARDVEMFLPEHGAKIVTLPFAPAPDPSWVDLTDDVRAKYGIHRAYFIVCNQFWKHKDHLTAYKAFALTMAQWPDVELVCTGQVSDYRNPSYVDELAAEAARLGIVPRLKVLGLLPKLEQIALLKHAVAVIQPTLFEGGPGGGAVYDAVALGVPALVSDIPVNLEIDEENVRFFRAGEPDALADLMCTQLARPPQRRPLKQELLASGCARRTTCGNVLIQAIGALNRAGS